MKRFIEKVLLALLASTSRCFPLCSFCYFLAFSALCYRIATHRNFYDIPLFYFWYSVFSLHWVFVPLTFSDSTKPLIPFSIVLLPAYVSLYYLISVKFCDVVEHAFIRKKYVLYKGLMYYNVAKIIFIVASSEFCISNLFTGFPWMNASYCWASSDIMIQVASLIGSNLFGIITVFCAALLGFSMNRSFKRWRGVGIVVSCVPIVIIYAFGYMRLSKNVTEYENITIRCVQGNIAQEIKNEPSMNAYVYDSYKKLSINEGYADIIVWPEACFPWIYSTTSKKVLESYVRDMCSECSVFITGIIRRNESGHYFNSVVAFCNGSSRVLYDKVHLLPFGEYMPLRNVMNKIGVGGLVADFVHGRRSESLSVNSIPSFQVCVCYESIFSREFVRYDDSKWILNITNDGWFKNSNENFQHNNMSRVIAVENGLPMIRVNNVGVSTVFDAYGRSVRNVANDTSAALDTYLPRCTGRTLYSRHKYIFDNIGCIVVCCLYLFAVLL